jgi:DNA-binding ferritin-like protein
MAKSKSLTRKSKKTRSRARKTKHNRSEKVMNNKDKSHVVKIFFEMLTTVKLYHWKTKSYAQHKATDELYGRLNDNIDKFIEVWLGKDESRIKMIEKKLNLLEYTSTTDFKEKMYNYRDFLTDMNKHFDAKKDTDLLSIRDDILVDLNQFLYLMTFH